MGNVNELATKADLEEAMRTATLRISVMIGLMVAIVLAATFVMARMY